ncbi:M1 family metallopeptidase [Myxococcota bacterium]|nr:M1 family metallopeptidase [Myxococcota bacterium]
MKRTLSTLAQLLPLTALAGSFGGPGTLAPDRAYDVRHLHLDLAVHPERRLVEGAVELRVAPFPGGDAELLLNQIALDIRAVRSNGAEVPYRVEGERLWVTLNPALGEQTVRVEYAATPKSGLHFRAPGPDSSDTYPEVWSQGEGEENRHWIPLPDRPDDRFTTSARITVPEGWRALSNGLGGFDGAAWTYRLDQEHVGYLIMLAAAPYEVRSASWRDRPIEQWIPPNATVAQAARTGEQLPAMLDLFSELTGVEYPYPTYREVFVQRFLYTGMENTTSTVMHRRVLGTTTDPAHGDGAESVTAHELAHQWYGDLLTCDTWSELWLNEGFATFFAAEWMRRHHGEARFAADLADRIQAASNGNPGPLAGRPWSTSKGDHGPNDRVYTKGSAVLQALRIYLGEDAFWAGIRRYTQGHAHGQVETEDLRQAMEQVSGRHLRWFFDQWVHRPGAPTLKASSSWSKGELTLSLSQTPPEGAEPFALPMTVEIGTKTGTVRRQILMDITQVRVVMPMEEAPEYVAFDPDGGLPLRLEVTQTPAMWLSQLKRSTPFAKVLAVRALGGLTPTPEITAALTELLRDPSLDMALEAAHALGERPHKAHHDALAAVAADATARLELRITATSELSRAPHDPAFVSVLAKIAKDAANHPDLRAAALTALRAHDRAQARSIAQAALRGKPSPGVSNPLAEAALDVLSRVANPDDLSTTLRWLSPQATEDALGSAIWASVTLAEAVEDREDRQDARAQVARAIEPLLRSPDLKLRRQAVSALGQVGDAQAMTSLKERALVETVPSLLNSIDAAIRDIQRAQWGAEEPEESATEGRLKALEEQLEALQGELEALERRR